MNNFIVFYVEIYAYSIVHSVLSFSNFLKSFLSFSFIFILYNLSITLRLNLCSENGYIKSPRQRIPSSYTPTKSPINDKIP